MGKKISVAASVLLTADEIDAPNKQLILVAI